MTLAFAEKIPVPVRNTMLAQKVTVAFEYPVYFTRAVFDPANTALLEALTYREPGRRHRVLLVVDSGLDAAAPRLRSDASVYFARHVERLALAAPPHVVPGGEAAKSDGRALDTLLRSLNELALDRQSFVLIAGGGAVLDMAGYAAAITHRGIRTVRLPSTVLAQADSGVGVKNGVNAFHKKNFIGTFAPPYAVLNDLRFLETLARRDKIAGMAEAAKVALVRDAAFFRWISERASELRAGEIEPLSELVRRSAELHLSHIATSGDPFEQGSARPLDFGHWAAHKLESMTEHRLRHGEAVAIGIALDALYSVECGYCAADVAEDVITTLEGLGFRLWDEALAVVDGRGKPRFLGGLEEFREHLGGELTVTMLRTVGEGFEVNAVREELVLSALRRLRGRGGR